MLLTALLRAKGIPARSRHGFGGDINPPYFEDHHVLRILERHRKALRWILVDAQLLGSVWKERFGFTFHPVDVPRDQLLTAGDAWAKSRSGEVDPSKIGTVNGKFYGLWFIAGSLVRNFAACNKVEMPQWDVWGAQPKPGAELTDDELAFVDHLANLVNNPNKTFGGIRAI